MAILRGVLQGLVLAAAVAAQKPVFLVRDGQMFEVTDVLANLARFTGRHPRTDDLVAQLTRMFGDEANVQVTQYRGAAGDLGRFAVVGEAHQIKAVSATCRSPASCRCSRA